MNLESWKKFFCEAGIPICDAATYAFKFAHNRIQTDMLVDLNKEYLKDMGITIMGDVIAILRHAKQVYEDIQKTSKTEFLEQKDKRKEKEITKVSKKTPIESTTMKTDVSKPAAKPPVKRKSESIAISTKKTVTNSSKKPKVIVADDNIEECEELGYVMIDSSKKSILFNQKLPKNVEKQFKTLKIEKTEKLHGLDSNLFHMSEDDDDDDNVEVIINDPIVTAFGGYKKFTAQDSTSSRTKEPTKGTNGQDSAKRTVFKRLGEEISQYSVTSTTPFEDDDQLPLCSRKLREDTAKLTQEKNSVFQRLGQKCDVTSTSVDLADKYSFEERKLIKSDLREDVQKITILTNSSKHSIGKKIKIEKDDDLDSNLSQYLKSTYSEGILASSGNPRKLSLRERVGPPKSTSNFKSRFETEYRREISNNYFNREKIASTKKRVSFGSVSEKLIPSREEAIRTGELPAAMEERTSVFDRLGFNRTY